jgi:glycogen debranching enzyme
MMHPLEILYGGGVGLSCDMNGELHAEELHGLFAGDTRVLSTYRFTVAGHPWRLLSRVRRSPSRAQWDMQNPTIRTPGADLPEGTLHLRHSRRVSGAMHDDLTVTSYAERSVVLRLALQLDADFADIFEVKDRSTSARLSVQRVVHGHAVTLAYERHGFRRGLHVALVPSAGRVTFVGAQIVLDVMLEPRIPWRCCVDAVPELDGALLPFVGDPHGADEGIDRRRGATIAADPVLAAPFERGSSDLASLTLSRTVEATPLLAAGAPWFLALFGRDMLVTSLMSGLLGSWPARGALSALGATQAHARDDYRDAEPGKIAHELREGELARFHEIPHTPYYGTHDAPALFVLALWNAFRWTGDEELVRRHLPAAEGALRWCERAGDADSDGLLEYRTRSKAGYRNQGWKDAGDAIVAEDGTFAALPIATVELQGYWYAARRAMAELLDALGDGARAAALRRDASRLRALVEERFWMEDAGSYALALDGRKEIVRSIASNAGHLLFCGLASRDRARRLAERLLAPDMFTGYGVRTLSADHRRYNPLSYQLGSVWPHDTMLLAAGLARYGLREEAATLVRGMLDAAEHFEQHRMPELFCGFDRSEGPPVAYEKANVPQAWAAAAPVLAAQIFLGLCPDAARRRCYLSPWLPDWLPALTLREIEVGGERLDVAIARTDSGLRIDHSKHRALEVVVGAPPAVLWGSPFDVSSST